MRLRDGSASLDGMWQQLEIGERSERSRLETELAALEKAAAVNDVEKALRVHRLKVGGLWKGSPYATWEQYCEACLPFCRRRADQLAAFVEIRRDLEAVGTQVPVNERQARPLCKLDPPQRAEVVARVEQAGGWALVDASKVRAWADELTRPPGALERAKAHFMLASMARMAGHLAKVGPASAYDAVKTASRDERQLMFESVETVLHVAYRWVDALKTLPAEEWPQQERLLLAA